MPVTKPHGTVPLADDVFITLCTLARDTVVENRTRAFEILGKLPVAESLMLDAFVKVSLSQSTTTTAVTKPITPDEDKANVSLTETNAEAYGDISAVSLEAADSLYHTGVNGTMVAGLEDEYQEVRMATVQAICHLSVKSRAFAKLAMDFVIGMQIQ